MFSDPGGAEPYSEDSGELGLFGRTGPYRSRLEKVNYMYNNFVLTAFKCH